MVATLNFSCNATQTRLGLSEQYFTCCFDLRSEGTFFILMLKDPIKQFSALIHTYPKQRRKGSWQKKRSTDYCHWIYFWIWNCNFSIKNSMREFWRNLLTFSVGIYLSFKEKSKDSSLASTSLPCIHPTFVTISSCFLTMLKPCKYLPRMTLLRERESQQFSWQDLSFSHCFLHWYCPQTDR